MEIKQYDGMRYRWHSCLDGSGFWMPETCWADHGMRDFTTAEDGAEYCQGLLEMPD
jgi:hypothetical protein